MIDSSFLTTFGKVLFSVTVIQGALPQEEADLLKEEVAKVFTPFLSPHPLPAFWNPLFDFETTSLTYTQRPDLMQQFLKHLHRCDLYHQPAFRTATLALFSKMATTYGTLDYNTKHFITTLEQAWQ